ncbi:MAG: hypothetical protein D6696_17120 [Acidobacteria bacterium]|nr:MAG: hypothetical protein D6696_17120 [Acidobacteriota bacterium]
MRNADAIDPASVPRRGWLPPLLLIAGLWAFVFPNLDQYGVTWDEALGDFFFGERYLSFFTSFDPAYLDFLSDPYPPERRPDLERSPFRDRPWEYYPVANVLAAATSAVLYRWLGWLDPFDGFHAVNPLLAALLIAVFLPFLRRRFGASAALAALVLLLSAPRVFCHLMANVKDFPSMVAFTVAAVALFGAYEAGSARRLVAGGVLWGLALGTKANALFLPFVLALVLLVDLARGTVPRAWRGRLRWLVAGSLGAGAAGAATMVAAWPYLWADPIGRFGAHLRYVGLRKEFIRPEDAAPVIEAVLLTTPPAFLLLVAAGLVPCLRRAWRGDRAAVLVLVWPLVVLGRYLLPAAVNFDGVRHFLELFPPLAAIAGLGAASVTAAVARRVPGRREEGRGGGSSPGRRPLAAALLALLLVPGVAATLGSHPFQIAYWNLFAGGPAGAYARGLPQAGDYWGMSYRQGIDWLNEHAAPGAALAVPVIEHAVYLVAPERLREDVELLHLTTPYSPRLLREGLERLRRESRRRPVYVMFVERREWMNDLMLECLLTRTPVAAWQLDGAPLLYVYRYDQGGGG